MDKTIIATIDQINQIKKQFMKYQLPTTTQYMVFRAKIGTTNLTIYTSKKVHLQGPEIDGVYTEIASLIKLPIQESITKNIPPSNQSIIGTDEVGTGDYFGGIVVCACFVSKDDIPFLNELNVKDSKQLNDSAILKIAPILIKNLEHEVILLKNEKYNEITTLKDMNLNKIKALMHNQVIKKILKKSIRYDEIIIDGFTSPNNYFKYLSEENEVIRNVKLIEKAEDKYLAVASASIIARFSFLLHMNELSKRVGCTLPKGSSIPVEEFLYSFIKAGKENELNSIAKLNFKTTLKVKEKLSIK